MPDIDGGSPPGREGSPPSGTARSCPFCGGSETELSNTFGAHASVSTWWCRDCRSPFEAFKWGNHPDEVRDADD